MFNAEDPFLVILGMVCGFGSTTLPRNPQIQVVASCWAQAPTPFRDAVPLRWRYGRRPIFWFPDGGHNRDEENCTHHRYHGAGWVLLSRVPFGEGLLGKSQGIQGPWSLRLGGDVMHTRESELNQLDHSMFSFSRSPERS